MTYISSQSFTTPMRLSILQIQTEMAKTQAEISSGTKADIGMSLGAQTGTALSLQSEMDLLGGYTNTNALASARLSSTSNTLTSMLTAAQKMAQTLTEATGVGGSSALQTTAQSALQGLVAGLNTTSGGQFIFGGINSDTQPIAAYADGSAAKTAAQDAFQNYLTTNGYTASTLTADQMKTFLDGDFAALFDDSNWSANWSSASDKAIQTSISPSQSLTTSVSGNDKSFRPIAQAYAMLSQFSDGSLSTAANGAMISASLKLVSTGIANLNTTTSGVGIAQSTLDTNTTALSAQVQVLTANVNDLESVDPATLSIKITQLQTQLEASYSLTAQLSKLSLVNYLG